MSDFIEICPQCGEVSTPIKWIASPKDYTIRISWKDSSSAYYLNYKRIQRTSKGYPFIYE